MRIKRSSSLGCVFVLSMLSLSIFCSELFAAPLWQRFMPFSRVKADPNQRYELTAQHGPWLVLTKTFFGEDAKQQARKLVFDLRKNHNLEAYIYSLHIDLSKPEVGRGFDKYGNPKKMRNQLNTKSDQVIVLVGNYRSVDDRTAQKTLKRIKALSPQSLRARFANRNQQTGFLSRSNRSNPRPLASAFLTSNPMLPKQFFNSQGVDKLIEQVNRGVKYSLLNCKGKYTVQVATFTGKITFDKNELKRFQDLKKGGRRVASDTTGKLAKAAEKAHLVCLALRKKGYEAYEFHDRASSIVTIGSFQSVGKKRADGKIEINPTIHKIMKVFKAREINTSQKLRSVHANQFPKRQQGYLQGRPKMIAGIALDVQPVPVLVPRRSIAADYNRRLSARR